MKAGIREDTPSPYIVIVVVVVVGVVDQLMLPEVKKKALEWIDNDGGLELWEESAGGGWKKVT